MRFNVLLAASVEAATFWAVTPCSLLQVYQRIRRTNYIHHHLHWRRRQWFLCNVSKLIPDCTALHKRSKLSTLIEMAGRRVPGRNFTEGKFKPFVGIALFTCQDHLQTTQLLLSSFESFHCVLLTGSLWKISGTLNYRRSSQIIHRLPEVVPDFSRSKMLTLLPGSLIHFH